MLKFSIAVIPNRGAAANKGSMTKIPRQSYDELQIRVLQVIVLATLPRVPTTFLGLREPKRVGKTKIAVTTSKMGETTLVLVCNTNGILNL